MTTRDLAHAAQRCARHGHIQLGTAMAVLVLAAPRADAAHRFGDNIVIERDEVVSENLTVMGQSVVVHGTVDGDLLVLASDIRVDGTVTGDVLAGGAEVTILGDIGGDIRAAAADLSVRAPTPGDVVAVGGAVTLDDAVGGEALGAGGTVTLRGPVRGDALLAGGELFVDGAVGGNAWTQGRNLALGPHARIDGDLVAQSGAPMTMAPGAVVAGALRETLLETPPPAAAAMLGWLQLLVWFFVLALLWRWLSPATCSRATSQLRRRPGQSFLWGLGTFLVAPFVLVGVAVAGAVVGGWWLSILGACAYAIVLALAVPVVATVLAEVFPWRRSMVPAEATWPGAGPHASTTSPTSPTSPKLRTEAPASRWMLLLALATLTLSFVVPGVGALASLATVWMGLGALVSSGWVHLRQRRSAPPRAVEPAPVSPIEPAPAGA